MEKVTTNEWQKIYKHLKNGGFDVYSPAQHIGECLAPYVVVRTGNTVKFNNFSSTNTTYEILCYIPRDQYSKFEAYKEDVKNCMRGLYPEIVPTFNETPDYYDDEVNAHMVSIEYLAHRKIIL